MDAPMGRRWSKFRLIPKAWTPPVLVAGIPRSGTTLMWRALAGYPPGSATPKNDDGPVLKSHRAPPASLGPGYRAVFLFGDVVPAVISTRLHRYGKQHFQNCGVTAEPSEVDIFAQDVLGYEALFDSWMKRQPFPTMCLRYEKLPRYRREIKRFTGARLLLLPQFKPRLTDGSEVSAEDRARIERSYAGLIDKVAAAPDLTIYA